jgi:hypothetical protein
LENENSGIRNRSYVSVFTGIIRDEVFEKSHILNGITVNPDVSLFCLYSTVIYLFFYPSSAKTLFSSARAWTTRVFHLILSK